MLAAVHVLLPQPEEGVWDDAGVGGVGEAAVDKGNSQETDQTTIAQAAEACNTLSSRGAVHVVAQGEVSYPAQVRPCPS